LLVLSLGVVGWAGLCPAELGAQLATLLYHYTPVELFRQGVIGWELAGGQPPEAGPAWQALLEVQDSLQTLSRTLAGEGGWPQTLGAVREAQLKLAEAAGAVGQLVDLDWSEISSEQLDNLAATLAAGREAMDQLVLTAGEEAGALGESWEFQVAFLTQTVLLAPGTPYLNLAPQWLEYLEGEVPGWFPIEGREALGELIGLANRPLSPEEGERAREAASRLLKLVLERCGGGG